MACNALLVPFLFSFHILLHDVHILLPFQHIVIITHLDLGGGLGSKLVYYMYVVHFYCYYGLLFYMSWYSPIHAEGEYPNALCFFEVRGRAPTRNV